MARAAVKSIVTAYTSVTHIVRVRTKRVLWTLLAAALSISNTNSTTKVPNWHLAFTSSKVGVISRKLRAVQRIQSTAMFIFPQHRIASQRIFARSCAITQRGWDVSYYSMFEIIFANRSTWWHHKVVACRTQRVSQCMTSHPTALFAITKFAVVCITLCSVLIDGLANVFKLCI